MIKTADIYRSIVKLLESNFDNISIQSTEITSPDPPCFYLNYDRGRTIKIACDFEEERSIYELIYISSKEQAFNLLEVKDCLGKIFSKPLQVFLTKEDGTEDGCIYQEIAKLSFRLNSEKSSLSCRVWLDINQNISDTDDLAEETNEELIEEMTLSVVTKGETRCQN